MFYHILVSNKIPNFQEMLSMHYTRNRRFDANGDLVHCLDPGIFKVFFLSFHPLAKLKILSFD